MSTYRLQADNGEDLMLADVHGRIGLIAYATNELAQVTAGDNDREITVKFTETDGIGGQDVRVHLSVTADAETAVSLLKAKIRRRKKAETLAAEKAAQAAEGGEGGSVETAPDLDAVSV